MNPTEPQAASPPAPGPLQRACWRAISWADAKMNRLYGWRLNPLYHSGAIACAMFLILLLTGLYLVLFYRLGDPYASIERINGQVWLGRWIRALHRYASAAAVVAALVHALRVFAQHRSWGARSLAWVSGLVLFGLVLVCGWTGYVMVWDVQAQVLAVEGAKLLDALPIFSEPISRAFVSEKTLPGAFFFLNLFLHIALPVGLGLGLWVHVSRLARPGLLPPRPLLRGVVGCLLALSVLWPPAMAARANLHRIPEAAPFDVFYSFIVPPVQALPAGVVWGIGLALGLGALLAPIWTRPRRQAAPPPSVVDEEHCTGCGQCYLDCPYEAIAMVDPGDGRPYKVARVEPELCASCGICAGSCAPMRVGPAGRTGREQLARAREFLLTREPGPGEVIVIGCERGAVGRLLDGRLDGAPVYGVDCAGTLHTSVIEAMVRSNAAGVLVLACPPRDCWNREGAKWLRERMYEDREAELHPRVDRGRFRLEYLGAGERSRAIERLRELRLDLRDPVGGGGAGHELVRACEPAQEVTP